MELETISYFITVAECLNFSEAADIHHISQSSFSKAIMRLEKDLGVRLLDNMAFVNLSSNMYRCCQSLTAQQERNLIYAIVNTLTSLKRITAVQFQVEGETVDTLVSEIFLRGPLIRNPGLIVKPEPEESAEPTETP